MADMNGKLDTWKNRLLDLGKRNQLLNYKDTRLSNLRIIKPEIFELWESFVLREEPLTFPMDSEDGDLDASADPETLQAYGAPPEDGQLVLFDGKSEEDGADFGSEEPSVITNKSPKELQRALRNIRSKVKTVMEEQGVNVLYLSFGFLRWTEASQSRVTLDSPLVLVPVILNLESITSPFVLSLHEDEIVLNPTLSYKMENDFGIKLPEFSPEGDLSDFFSALQEKVSPQRWQVVPEVGLSLLSFLKINMYQDLERNRDKITQNPVIRALAGDARAVSHEVSFSDNYDHDKNSPPMETFQVVDADSSQQDAILCAKRGISFVLQGPPGTGKSQTITNIIAESIAAGKKVLFVSEKMAALEVVHKRLKEAGLADFCLILHSHKANKKNTLEQLGSVLKLAGQKTTLTDDAVQKLSQLMSDRARLNDYSDAIYTVIEPLHKTIFEVNGYLANLQEYPDVTFPVTNIRQTTVSQYIEYINALHRLANILSKLSVSSQDNPWRGSTVKLVTNDLRGQVSLRVGTLLPQLAPIYRLYDEIRSILGLELDTAYSFQERNIAFLRACAQLPEVPPAWLFDRQLDYLRADAESAAADQREYQAQLPHVLELKKEISTFDPSLDFSALGDLRSDADVEAHLNAVNSCIQARDYYSIWDARRDQNAIRSLYALCCDIIRDYNVNAMDIASGFERDIFNIDYNGMYLRFKSEYTSFFKALNGKYRADRRLMQGLCRDAGRKLADSDILSTLQKLRNMEELKERLGGMEGSLRSAFGSLYQAEKTDFDLLSARLTAYEKLAECRSSLEALRSIAERAQADSNRLQRSFGPLYKGLDTNWNTVHETVAWVAQFHRDFDSIAMVNKGFMTGLVHPNGPRAQCQAFGDRLSELYSSFSPGFDWFLTLFDSQTNLRSLPAKQLEARLRECHDDMNALEEWIDTAEARQECYKLGLRPYLDQLDALCIPPEAFVPVFQKRFFKLWLDQVLPEFPSVARFRHRDHEEVIREFAELDKLQLNIARSRIRSSLINGLPSLDHFTSGVDEVSTLKRELGKQRRIKPIRVLFREIPNLILALKPCLMMSPLSVSLFLESDAFHFDTVIFDEASQVCTENAVGAIFRGKQVIIAGDRRQLPPTSFFNVKMSEGDFDGGDDEDEDDSAGFESILDEAALLPERTLRWHYRSRHEHLIAFSNKKIYGDQLITFPSNIDRSPDLGVEYIYVPAGFYDRGGRKGNVPEAAKVAELVFDHFRRFPQRSLGVIAFGEVQQIAIETAIRRLRLENQQLEPFFREDSPEAFFVKSLENVQGDERDTIIFSIGYAKDAAGVMRMNFGPLSQSGGQRRLNVAMTRAKYNVKLVGSIQPTDIDLDKVSSEGPRLLREYIDFAKNGPSVLVRENTQTKDETHDSPFEESVYGFLASQGYQLAAQVGCSGYRIDMAVKHPTLSGRYVLGIECDGASYHSARTARERDRLRQDILESMGWTIYRIWSTDWVKDPVSEGKRLLAAVEKAIAEYAEEFPEPAHSPEGGADEPPNKGEFIMIEDKSESTESKEHPYGFAPYVVTDFSKLRPGKSGKLSAADYVDYAVRVEFPIHYDLLCQRIAPLMGREKASQAVRQLVDSTLRILGRRVNRRNDFLYPSGFVRIPARQRDNREIKYISPDELAEAMLLVLDKCIGTTRSGLIDETTRAYGFTRRGTNISAALNTAYEQLLASHRIKESEGKTFRNK